jgi:hypothetical protein
MRVRFSATTGAALLLAGMAVLHASLGRSPTVLPPGRPQAAVNWMALLRCEEQVANIHDVHWAAACMANEDDSAECTLPDERAGPLNMARAKAEARCVIDATSESVAGEAAARGR